MIATVALTALREEALEHHAADWPVIPVGEDKRPLCKWSHWRDEAQTAADVLGLFSRPAHGLALLTWPASNLVVLDFDGPHAEAGWEATGIELPDTARTRTRSGGAHHVFRMPPDAAHPALEAAEREVRRKVRVVKADCACVNPETGRPKPCGADLLLNGYFVVPPTPGYTGDPDHPLEPGRLAVIPEAVLDLAATEERRQGSDSRADGNCARIPQGERNATLASLAGTMRKRGMTAGAIEAALLAENAARCDPPLPEAEVRAIARSIARYSPPRTAGLETTTMEQTNDPPPWPDPPAPEAFHDLAGDFARALELHTEADPVALLAQFLIAFGNVIGRRPHFMVEATRHALNLFAVLVGVTAKGRKGTAWGHVRRAFEAVDATWVSARVLAGLSSGEGLIWHVRDAIEKQEPIRDKGRVTGYETVLADPGEPDKRLFVTEEEFAGTLRVLGREGNTLSAIIRQAWDKGDLRVLTKNTPAKATGAHISILGHVTRDELRRYLDSTEAGNGFANRFLWLCVRRANILSEGGTLDKVDLAPLHTRLRGAVTFAQGEEELRRDEEARAVWAAVYPDLSEGKPGLLGAVTARAEAQTMRLACLYALLDCSAVIRRDHLLAALALWEYAEASARFIFGDTLGDPLADEILRALRANPEKGLTRTGIRDLFGRNRRGDDIGRALGVLAERGLARMVPQDTGGRPAERWVAVSQTTTKTTETTKAPA